MAVIAWKLITYWSKTKGKSFTDFMKECNLSPCIPYNGPEYFENASTESYFEEEAANKYLTLGK